MRRRWTWLAVVVVVASVGAACGSKVTGVSLAIDPDPVQANRAGGDTYAADWDAVVADLTGVGGTIQSIDASVMGATTVTTNGRLNPPGFRLPSPNMALASFERRLFHQSAQFTAAPGQAVSVQVTVEFRDEGGQTYQQTAQARVVLR
jgi:hypothetical protein